MDKSGRKMDKSGLKMDKSIQVDTDALSNMDDVVQDGTERAVLYTVDEKPPLHICIVLGFQHFLTAVGGIISIPLILAPFFCMDEDVVGLSEIMGTIIFVSGLATLLQSTFGVRLPIVQGSTPSFLIPTISLMLQSQWKCEWKEARELYGPNVNFTAIGLAEVGSPAHKEEWKSRVREVQGAIMVASLFQVLIGLSGIMTFALRFIGPLSIAPIITLTGFSLFPIGTGLASGHWWIALTTTFLVLMFSQYMKRFKVPICAIENRRCKANYIALFTMFPVLLGVLVACVICIILSVTDVLPDDPTHWGHKARIDRNIFVLREAKWFRFPYPGQWGTPTVSVPGVFGMLAGVLAAMLESVGDYYACARLAGAPPPPTHAINRGIFVEGIACILTGAWGSGNGTTSFSENIGVIGITRVGSRRVVQVGGLIMLILGCFGKFSAIFTLIPQPVYGGLFMVTFGMVAAVGISNLQYVDLNSPRNLCIIGVSMFFGLGLPLWIQNHDVIKTGNDIIDQILSILLGTSMFVGGLVAFILDNTISGTDKERGIKIWREKIASNKHYSDESAYDPPFFNEIFKKIKWMKFVPICPNKMSRSDSYSLDEGQKHVNMAYLAGSDEKIKE
ncbi:hypothetical protein ACF0H5_022444 [Mactra antiquata]